MKRYLLYILLSIVLFAGCTRGQWLDEIVAQRDKQAEVVPILLDAYDKGLLVTSVEEIECTDKYLGHSEYSRCYRLTLSNDTVVEIQDVDTWHNFEKRGQAYVLEILMGYQVIEFLIWLPDEEWKQTHEDLVSEDGASVLFSLPINESGNDSGEDITTSIPDNEIWYTSTDGAIVGPSGGFNTNIVSNTYENGQGVITFSSTLTTIGKNAFLNCDRLKSVILPNTITSIELGAFHYCYSLESVNIPYGITTIEMDTFSECISLRSIRIPDSVTVIGDWAFHLCTSLTEVTIPAGVTTIGGCAFDENPNLARVYCKPTTPPQIDSSTFYGSGYFTLYVPENSVNSYINARYWNEYDAEIVGYDFENGEIIDDGGNEEGFVSENRKIYYTTTDGNVVIPFDAGGFGANIVSNTYKNGQGVIIFDGDVTTIDGWTFGRCTTLESIDIPCGVSLIGDCAFNECVNLKDVVLPEGLSSIEASAFANCESLSYITIPQSVTFLGFGAFDNSGLKSITIPDNVTTIWDWCFRCCKNLVKFEGKYASEDGRCLIVDGTLNSFAPAGLSEYVIPNTVSTIGSYSLFKCSNLTHITIPESVTHICGNSFRGCSKITNITIPPSVTGIDDCVFYDCINLTDVYCMSSTPPSAGGGIHWLTFDNNPSRRKIYVPEKSVDEYKAAHGWSNYASAIVGYDF